MSKQILREKRSECFNSLYYLLYHLPLSHIMANLRCI